MSRKNLSQSIILFYSQRYQKMTGYNKAKNLPPLNEMIAYLSLLPDYVYGLYAFLHEPLCFRINDAERDTLLYRCMQEGINHAEKIKRDYAACSPTEIAKELDLVIERPSVPTGDGRVLFAEFEEPSTIRIHQSVLSKAAAVISENQLENFFLNIDIEEILVAHELFHYVEMTNKNSIFSLNHRISLWRVGPYCHTSRLAVLSEITAMAFAKKLLGLSFSPYLFDVFFTYLYNPDTATKLFQEIQKLGQDFTCSST